MDSDEAQDSSIARVVNLDRRISQRLRRATNDSWLDISLPLPALRAVLAIDREPGITPSEIADYLSVSRPTASIILDRLEGDGLLQRTVNPADRRQFLMSLTSAGQVLVERIDGQRRHRLCEALERLSPEQLEALALGMDALESVLTALEAQDAKPVAEGAAPK